jgi:hypothetical protein
VRLSRYFLVPALSAVAVSSLAALAFSAARAWWDLHDVPSYVGWTVPLALACGALAAALRQTLRTPTGRVHWVAATVVGAVLGVLWSYMAAMLLGGWIFGFGFPVLYCWSLGGAAAGLSAAALARRDTSFTASRVALSRVLVRLVGIPLAVAAGAALFYVSLVFGSVYVWNRAQHEVHLIPAGFRGAVVVIFNDSAGAPEEYEGRSRLYRIPPSGVLRTQFGPNEGWGRPDYYYLDQHGRRSRIVPGTPCDDSLPGDSVQACLMGRKMWGSSDGPTWTPVYSAYEIGQRADRREGYDRGDRLLDSLFAPKIP